MMRARTAFDGAEVADDAGGSGDGTRM